MCARVKIRFYNYYTCEQRTVGVGKLFEIQKSCFHWKSLRTNSMFVINIYLNFIQLQFLGIFILMLQFLTDFMILILVKDFLQSFVQHQEAKFSTFLRLFSQWCSSSFPSGVRYQRFIFKNNVQFLLKFIYINVLAWDIHNQTVYIQPCVQYYPNTERAHPRVFIPRR